MYTVYIPLYGRSKCHAVIAVICPWNGIYTGGRWLLSSPGFTMGVCGLFYNKLHIVECFDVDRVESEHFAQ